MLVAGENKSLMAERIMQMGIFKLPGAAKSAPDLQRAGGDWNPEQHYTGNARNIDEVRAIQALVDKYGHGIDAYYDYAPFPGTYSLELQFRDKDTMRQCRTDYHDLFDDDGDLKPEHRHAGTSIARRTEDAGTVIAMVRVSPQSEPEVIRVRSMKKDEVSDLLEQTFRDDPTEMIPYPSQLGDGGRFRCFVLDDAIHQPIPYNCWGILGTFLIAKLGKRGRVVALTDKDAQQVLADLRDSRGYLDPECLVASPLRDPFIMHGEPPSGAVPTAGRWFK